MLLDVCVVTQSLQKTVSVLKILLAKNILLPIYRNIFTTILRLKLYLYDLCVFHSIIDNS